MKLFQRIAYYGAGFIVGLIILFFFLGGKKTSCDYGPDARTLKNIRSKELRFAEQITERLTVLQLDSSAVKSVLRNGDVDFSESITHLDSCNIYTIVGNVSEQDIRLKIRNCDKVATVLSLQADN